ncbi:hypothetical protein HNR46_000105 [Haloferula luteola]|uniref:Uncharacterized protein n=1 Tax=Haloferula luteola TaxID=595692 RepID=A0A840V2J0_9BACT|nr:hypothetical protein [Haloferula luteola]
MDQESEASLIGTSEVRQENPIVFNGSLRCPEDSGKGCSAMSAVSAHGWKAQWLEILVHDFSGGCSPSPSLDGDPADTDECRSGGTRYLEHHSDPVRDGSSSRCHLRGTEGQRVATDNETAERLGDVLGKRRLRITYTISTTYSVSSIFRV